MRTSSMRAFAAAVFLVGIGLDAVRAPAQVLDVWRQIGSGIIGSGKGPSGANPNSIRYHKSGKAIQASWRRDERQGRRVLWIGTRYGGLWKSLVNADGVVQRWVPLTDNLPGSHGMGAFLVHAGDSEKILIGPSPSDDHGNIYRTRTQGDTWTAHALGANVKAANVFRMIDGRANGDIVLACTDKGIYRTTNFGLAWDRVEYVPKGIGPASCTDIVQDTADPQIWYAGALIEHAILRSVDDGVTWQPYSPGDPIEDTVGRVSLAACASDENVLFALVLKKDLGNGDRNPLNGLYRSVTRGVSWTKIFDDNEAVNHTNQGAHNNAIACDPTNPNHLLFGDKDALETFTALRPPASITWRGYDRFHPGKPSDLDLGHGDHNYFLFRDDDSRIVLCNDGGYYLYDPDTGTVDDSGNTLGIEANRLTVDQGTLAASRSNPNRFIAGLQDNGIVLGDLEANTLTGLYGFDGGQATLMPDRDSVIAASATQQRVESVDAGQSWFDINLGLDDQAFSSVRIDPTPGLESPHIFTHSRDTFGLASRVYFRLVFDLFSPWRLVSDRPVAGEISHLDHTTNPAMHELILTVTGRQALLKYSGPRSDLGRLALDDITPPLPPLTNKKNDARANADKSGFQHDTIYYTTGLSRPSRAFYSTGGGQHWTDVTGDLPTGEDGPDFNMLIGNPRMPNQFFLATSRGVYRTDTRGTHWYLYSAGLRLDEDVQDIVINVHGLDIPTLYAGTWGRGLWKIYVQEK